MTRAELRRQILSCTRCDLRALATSPVPWRGPDHPDLLCIGEAPGRWEDRHRKPFIGPSGSLLGRLLADAGWDVNDQVAFANTVSCFPNRAKQTPTWQEVDACARNLDDQIKFLSPERIVLLGLTASERWWPNVKMVDIRGRWFTVRDRPAMVTYHPAAVLRDPALEMVTREDLAKMFLGPTLTCRDDRDYRCVRCERDAEIWVSEGRDVSSKPGGLGIGWCIRDLRKYRRGYRSAGGGAVQLSLENA